MLLTTILVVALSGCDNFDNRLRWEESPIADDLIGTWKAVEGPDAGVRARVTGTDDQALKFVLTFPEKTESALHSGRYKQRATFLGDVLGSESLHVLQVRMASYYEFDEEGEPLGDLTAGFQFLRIDPSPENGVHVHRLNAEALGRVAENELAPSGYKIEGEAFTRCLSENIRAGLGAKVWTEIREELDEGLLAEFDEAMGLDQQQVKEIERGSAKLAELAVDPYEELSHIRTCIAASLPSKYLERLFSQYTDLVFSGETDRYVRE